MIILDTNVVSAMMRFEHEPAVVAWVDRQLPDSLFVTSISVFEVQFGLERMPMGKRRRISEERLQDILNGVVGGRVLQFDRQAAMTAAQVHIARGKAKANAEAPDTLIAGVALQLGATVATRITKDFRRLGFPLIDPWTA